MQDGPDRVTEAVAAYRRAEAARKNSETAERILAQKTAGLSPEEIAEYARITGADSIKEDKG